MDTEGGKITSCRRYYGEGGYYLVPNSFDSAAAFCDISVESRSSIAFLSTPDTCLQTMFRSPMRPPAVRGSALVSYWATCSPSCMTVYLHGFESPVVISTEMDPSNSTTTTVTTEPRHRWRSDQTRRRSHSAHHGGRALSRVFPLRRATACTHTVHTAGLLRRWHHRP